MGHFEAAHTNADTAEGGLEQVQELVRLADDADREGKPQLADFYRGMITKLLEVLGIRQPED